LQIIFYGREYCTARGCDGTKCYLCSTLYLAQILFRNFSDGNFLIFIPSVKNILAEVFLTGLFAPFICSQLIRMFKFSRRKV